MTVVGNITLIAKIDTSQYKRGTSEIKKANQDMESSSSKSSSNMKSSFIGVAKVGLAAVAAAAVAVGALIAKNFDNAVKRVDTLNNAGRTFENMGFNAKVVDTAMKALDKSITGLPTPLDSAVRGMTSLAATYGDIAKGQKVFSSLNNAILGFGGSAEMVDNAILQLSQVPMDGPLDGETWRSLRNSGLTPVLVAMAKDMGLSVDQMKEKFGEGELTVQDFTDKLIEMNKKGGGGMKSLEKIAKDATSGIGTGIANMNTAITKGIAAIIESVGSKEISSGIAQFGVGFRTALEYIATGISKVVEFLAPFIKDFQFFFGEIMKNQQVVDGLKIVIMGLAIAIGAIVAIIALAAIGIAAAFLAIGFVLGWLKDTIVNFVTDTVTNIGNFVAEFMNKFNLLRTGLAVIWNNIKAVIFNTVMAIVVFIRAYLNTVISIWNSGWAAIGNFVRTTWNNIVSAVSNGVNNVISFVRNIPNTVRALFSNAGSWLINAGKDMINGLINGIKNGAGAVKDAVLNIAKGAEGAIKDFFGIRSPSKMFAGIGADLMQGLSNGIAGGGRGVVNAMNGINGSLSSAALSSISSPSISPVSVSGITGSATIEGSTENPIVNNIGTINVASDVDADRLLQRLTNNSEVISKGLTPTRSYL